MERHQFTSAAERVVAGIARLAGRGKLENVRGHAEAIADQTRAALEQTETALRTARSAI
jgi:ElaB/YqjD/DUF883 family membrane-anchored ribosome-binding protein